MSTRESAPHRSFSMLAWALNEEENVAEFIDRAEGILRQLTDDFELVFINDASRDRTLAIIQDLQGSRPWLKVFSNPENRGSGYNTKRAISLATKEFLFWQTVDWSYDISALPRTVRFLDQADCLQGYRPGALTWAGFLERSDSAPKAVISIVNYWLVRLLFGIAARDFQNVSLYRASFIQALPLESESAFTNPECLIKAYWSGARVQEFPVPFVKRVRGAATGTRLPVVLRSIRDVIYFWWRWRVLGRLTRSGRGEIRRDEIPAAPLGGT